jgi:hypothetical protein
MSPRLLLIASAISLGLCAPVFAQTPAPAPAPMAPMGTSSSGADMFFTEALTPTHWRASEAMGMDVYNRAGENIGEINELLIDGSGRVVAAVIGVGGVMGLGERKIAVSYRSFEMRRESDGTPRLLVDLSKNVLQNAPEYKAPAAAKRG